MSISDDTGLVNDLPCVREPAPTVDMFLAERYNILSGYPPELSSA